METDVGKVLGLVDKVRKGGFQLVAFYFLNKV